MGPALRQGFYSRTVSVHQEGFVLATRTDQIFSRWRSVADTYCDEALLETFPSLNSSTGVDLFECVERKALEGPGPARDFLHHVTSMPPEGIRASDAQIHRGQKFFYVYSAPILSSLMHFSLAGGFAR